MSLIILAGGLLLIIWIGVVLTHLKNQRYMDQESSETTFTGTKLILFGINLNIFGGFLLINDSGDTGLLIMIVGIIISTFGLVKMK